MTNVSLSLVIISLSSLTISCSRREMRSVETVRNAPATPIATPNRTATVLPATDGDVTEYPLPRQDIHVQAPGEDDAPVLVATAKPGQQHKQGEK